REAEEKLAAAGLPKAIMVDCSHANSGKDAANQPKVAEAVLEQVEEGNNSIIGLMVESNLRAGNQKFPQPKENLEYGVSITDACIDWETTETMIRRTHEILGCRFTSA